MKLEHSLTPYKKIKWIKDLNVRPETIKLLEENIGKILSNINHSKILHDPSPRILEIEAKISKWGLIKTKSFCITKEAINKVKGQPSEWEKIIANKATDKQLISKIYNAWGWYIGMTQRDGMGREVGRGGFRMGNTCTPVEDSC